MVLAPYERSFASTTDRQRHPVGPRCTCRRAARRSPSRAFLGVCREPLPDTLAAESLPEERAAFCAGEDMLRGEVASTAAQPAAGVSRCADVQERLDHGGVLS